MKFFFSNGAYIAEVSYTNSLSAEPYDTFICKLDSGAFITYFSSTAISAIYHIDEKRLTEQVKRSSTPKMEFGGFNNTKSMVYFLELHNLRIDNALWERIIVLMKEISEADKERADREGVSTEKILLGADIIQCCNGKIHNDKYIELTVADAKRQRAYVQSFLKQHGESADCFRIDEVC